MAKGKTKYHIMEKCQWCSLVTGVCVVLVGVFASFFMSWIDQDNTLASAQVPSSAFVNVTCSSDYHMDYKKFEGCVPYICGRGYTDDLVTKKEALQLLEVAKRGFVYGGSYGGASILDLHSGALSKGSLFINIYSALEPGTQLLSASDLALYTSVKQRIRSTLSRLFGQSAAGLHLTKPTFFSRMTAHEARTKHDEYWHKHVDKETYGSFHYTALVYLSTYSEHFDGGRFYFVDNTTRTLVEPRIGRVSFFTSGSENRHFVEKVTNGTRYALTVAFSCDPAMAIKDPTSAA